MENYEFHNWTWETVDCELNKLNLGNCSVLQQLWEMFPLLKVMLCRNITSWLAEQETLLLIILNMINQEENFAQFRLVWYEFIYIYTFLLQKTFARRSWSLWQNNPSIYWILWNPSCPVWQPQLIYGVGNSSRTSQTMWCPLTMWNCSYSRLWYLLCDKWLLNSDSI